MSKTINYLAVTVAILTAFGQSAGAMTVARSGTVLSTDAPLRLVHEGHHQAAKGSGVISAIDAGTRKITLNHGPIQAFGWPAMTTDFVADLNVDLAGLKVGMTVDFSVKKASDGTFVVESVTPAAEH